MWGAVIRIGARYAFFRRWKNTIIAVGAILLCGVTVFLIDAKMYLSAGFVGALAAVVIFGFVSQYYRERREMRQRELRKREQDAQRAAVSAAMSEKVDKVRTSAAGVVASAADMAASAAGVAKGMGEGVAKGVSEGAVGLAGTAKTGLSSARDKLGSWRGKS